MLLEVLHDDTLAAYDIVIIDGCHRAGKFLNSYNMVAAATPLRKVSLVC